MTAGIKANADGSAAIQVGGSDAITITSGLNTTFAGTVTSPTGALYPLVSGTAWTYTSGTPASVDFTGIPSTAKRITVMINGLSYAAAGVGILQIGSGSLTTTGYTSVSTGLPNAAATVVASATNGFANLNTASAGATLNAVYVLYNVSGNLWCSTLQSNRSDLVGTFGNGFIALGGVLDRLSLVATTSTFDAGTVNIMWE